ncbi:STAS/SEC14 domain-containing protein [Nitriliruptor alkaliphilus]|uniref:STAS/SEC14 domain-containing protein n=1 Tax=Nitriliruptor alkaliphilus TaxID=427918 RepID=UPI0006974FCC|nr:STAS/SEC14 domain-containing protein [Nitriliruptor alkaliphilus]
MGFETLPESSSETIGWRLEGRLSDAEVAAMHEQLDTIIADKGSARVLVDLTAMEGMEPSAVWKDLRRSVGKLGDIDRMAVIGGERWHRWLTTASDEVTPIEARHYAPAEAAAAWTWLRS